MKAALVALQKQNDEISTLSKFKDALIEEQSQKLKEMQQKKSCMNEQLFADKCSKLGQDAVWSAIVDLQNEEIVQVSSDDKKTSEELLKVISAQKDEIDKHLETHNIHQSESEEISKQVSYLQDENAQLKRAVDVLTTEKSDAIQEVLSVKDDNASLLRSNAKQAEDLRDYLVLIQSRSNELAGLRGQLTEADKVITQYQSENDSLSAKNCTLNDKLEALLNENNESETKVKVLSEELASACAKRDELQSKLENTLADVSQIQIDIGTLEKLENCNADIQQRNDVLRASQMELERRDVASKQQIDHLQVEITLANEQARTLQNRVKELETTIDEAKQSDSEAKATIAELTTILEETRKRLADHRDLYDSLKSKHDELESCYLETVSINEHLKKDLEIMNKKALDLEQEKEDTTSKLQLVLQKNQSDIVSRSNEIVALQQKINEMNVEFDAAQLLMQKIVRDYQRRIETSMMQLLQKFEQAHSKLKSQEERVSVQLEAARDVVAANTDYYNSTRSNLHTLENKLEETKKGTLIFYINEYLM